MKVTLADSAVRDLEDLVAHYEQEGVPDVGVQLVGEILDRIETLRDHPDLGRIVPEFDNSRLRELIYSPFRIVYRRDTDAARVVRIWRGERQLKPLED